MSDVTIYLCTITSLYATGHWIAATVLIGLMFFHNWVLS